MAVCLLPQNQMLPAFKKNKIRKYIMKHIKQKAHVMFICTNMIHQYKKHAYPENNILPDIYSLTCLIIWFGLPDSAL